MSVERHIPAVLSIRLEPSMRTVSYQTDINLSARLSDRRGQKNKLAVQDHAAMARFVCIEYQVY